MSKKKKKKRIEKVGLALASHEYMHALTPTKSRSPCNRMENCLSRHLNTGCSASLFLLATLIRHPLWLCNGNWQTGYYCFQCNTKFQWYTTVAILALYDSACRILTWVNINFVLYIYRRKLDNGCYTKCDLRCFYFCFILFWFGMVWFCFALISDAAAILAPLTLWA